MRRFNVLKTKEMEERYIRSVLEHWDAIQDERDIVLSSLGLREEDLWDYEKYGGLSYDLLMDRCNWRVGIENVMLTWLVTAIIYFALYYAWIVGVFG
ncbi:MAG: hypothetical protein ACXQTZ_00495 [Candidatus Alkanophagales archaeon]